MARCPDCNKFVPYGEGEVDVQSEEITAGEAIIEVRVMLPCEECGTELKEAYLVYENNYSCPECDDEGGKEEEHPCETCTLSDDKQDCETCEHKDTFFDETTAEGIPDIELESVDTEFTDRYETKDRNGKPIKNPRYQKHYYGAELTLNLRCNKCGHEWSEHAVVEEQASAFDELV